MALLSHILYEKYPYFEPFNKELILDTENMA